MRHRIFVFYFIGVVSCVNSNKTDTEAPQREISNDSFLEAPVNRYADTFGVALIDTVAIGVKLTVSPYSMDSIAATVRVSNKWYKSIWLYTPMLSDSFMVANAFTIIDKRFRNLPLAGKDSVSRFNSRNPDSGYVISIIKDIRADQLYELKRGDSIDVTCNLAKVHDFRYLKSQGEDYFRIEVSHVLPFIEKGRHVCIENYDLKVVQPVYFLVNSSDDVLMAWKQMIELPKK